MTPEELENPEKINGTARQRIATKSGQVFNIFNIKYMSHIPLLIAFHFLIY